MIQLLSNLYKITINPAFLVVVMASSIIVKASIALRLAIHGYKASKPVRPWRTLLVLLTSSFIVDFVWIIVLLGRTFFHIPPMAQFFLLRLGWAFFALQSSVVALFVESLINKNSPLSWVHKAYIFGAACLSASFFYFAFFYYNLKTLTPFEIRLETIACIYELFTLPLLFIALGKVHRASLPKLLKHQAKTLIQIIFIPYILADLIQWSPFSFWNNLKFAQPITNSPAVYSVASMLMTTAIYFIAKQMMGLRFLNMKQHVELKDSFNFIDNFREILEQLGCITTSQELLHTVRNFFKVAFNVPYHRTHLIIRPLNTEGNEKAQQYGEHDYLESTAENFISLNSPSNNVLEILKEKKIFITDELAFDVFYNDDETNKKILSFLATINADIFLPIWDNNTLTGYIIVEQEARKKKEFYNNVERDEMIVFASYLGNILHLLQNKNLNALLQKDKIIEEALHSKIQEIRHLKESIWLFMKKAREREQGILFYKNRKFFLGNQAIHQFVPENINTQDGHPLVKALRRLAKQVEIYRGQVNMSAYDVNGNRITLIGIPNLEHNNVLMVLRPPQIADILNEHLESLSDPSQWDYLLYLHATKAGNMINNVIPGNGAMMTDFKLKLMKMALSNTAILVDVPEEDTVSIVNCLHIMSGRTKLHTVSLSSDALPQNEVDTAIQLFGLNPIFGKTEAPSLFEQANKVGTIFIPNVDRLSLDAQKHLTEYLKYGYFRLFKSDIKRSSDARIICSTDKNLQTLVHDGKFSRELLESLKQGTLHMPSLLSLHSDELLELAEQYNDQAIRNNTFKNLFSLTEKDKAKILEHRPLSLHGLRAKIHILLSQKSKKNNVAPTHDTEFNLTYTGTDPDLAHAARLGKQALRDKKVMILLWHKFKNQNKIATFLGVNRSSVSRRCKEFHLE
ncbi:sigma 54-interacting transcriptional regulator [Candidatus Babeliales bacterium]|nr:sigma 54-interacting transcriptional regulator [Candidatus Babeliales bacterium]